MRSVPDFVIAGAYKSGTTSLRRNLSRHPKVFMARVTEPSFFAFDGTDAYPRHLLRPEDDPFSRHRVKTLSGYLKLFDTANPLQTVGECSPEYLRQPGSALRLHKHNPAVKVIVALRHPVDRVISDWMMCRRDGAETLSLPDALDAIDDRGRRSVFGAHYLDTSRYCDQIAEYYDTFPRAQVLVFTFENLTAHRSQQMAEICEFLEIDPTLMPVDETRHNRSGMPRSAVVAKFYESRRILAPVLADHTPQWMKLRSERLFARWLDNTVSDADRQVVSCALEGEIARVESVLGRKLPEWQ